MKIVTIVGARPQFIKAAALSREIKKHKDIQEIIVHTGQHYDYGMSEIFFQELEIPKPKYNLGINQLSHGAMTGRMLEKIEEILLKEEPDWVVVFGDTNSTLAGALAAKKLHIKVAHIEAGLRSFNTEMPEEINRILTDRISDILFCPTQTAIDNLYKEGYENIDCKIINCGDIMYDAALYYSKKSNKLSDIIARLKLKELDFVLATIHRAENTDEIDRLTSIVKALNKISENKRVIVPLHPRTKNIIENNKIDVDFEIINPVGYFDMIELYKHCLLVMTDSGGVQKEAYFFKKPCITLRDETEWLELIDEGVNVLVGADTSLILRSFNEMISKDFKFHDTLYGNGKTARIIFDILNGR